MESSTSFEALLVAPRTSHEAEKWLAEAVGCIGPRFHPDTPFANYAGVRLDRELGDSYSKVAPALDEALAAARKLLGEWIYDLAYRNAVAYLSRIDISWRGWARPLSQPKPRWWLVKQLSQAGQPTSIAFESRDGRWWQYSPSSGCLHYTPWLYQDYYYRSRSGEVSFQPLSQAEVKASVDALGRKDAAEGPPVRSGDRISIEQALTDQSRAGENAAPDADALI